MLTTASDNMPGKEIKKVLGLVMGNTIRAKHIGKDIVASFRNLVGGELNEYTEMLAESRKQALDRM
ncbi:MAG: heavy metal-binding domain-containing protein, partial [Candidatus Aenigmatarchaeota archaeon]